MTWTGAEYDDIRAGEATLRQKLRTHALSLGDDAVLIQTNERMTVCVVIDGQVVERLVVKVLDLRTPTPRKLGTTHAQ